MSEENKNKEGNSITETAEKIGEAGKDAVQKGIPALVAYAVVIGIIALIIWKVWPIARDVIGNL